MTQQTPQPNPACTSAGRAYAVSALENIHNAFAANNPQAALHIGSRTDLIRLSHALGLRQQDRMPTSKHPFFEEVARAASTQETAKFRIPAGKSPFEISLDTSTGAFLIERRINKNTVHKYEAKIPSAQVDPSCAPTKTSVVTPALNSAAIPRETAEIDAASLHASLGQLEASTPARSTHVTTASMIKQQKLES
jgi:hypothetical protein